VSGSSRPLRALGGDDAAALQDLLERCADYFRLVDGREPTPGAADELLRVRPPGTDPGDKIVLGLGEERLDGVVDLVRGWPEPGTWLIGLLLLDPALRGRGAGADVVAALDRMAATGGAERLRAAVVHANTRALRFWRAQGFREVPPRGPGATALERSVQSADS
jgi:RimJ/RimL family protein N-acetyltransferase